MRKGRDWLGSRQAHVIVPVWGFLVGGLVEDCGEGW